jgi:membrane protease YdiL (CAAX protease family)
VWPAPAGHPATAKDQRAAVAYGLVLVVYNNVIGARGWHGRWYTPVNAAAAGASLAAAAASGLTAADLGFGRGRWLPGRLGSALAAATAAGWLAAVTIPAARPVLDDKRITDLDGRGLAYQTLVRIPVGTVLWEEIAFRGVLQAALRRVMSEPAAIAVTSGVFGLWHIRPTAGALRANGLAGGRGQAVAGVTAGVAATAAGGAAFSWLRARSGRLAAPVALHLAINCGGLAAAWAATRPVRGEGEVGGAAPARNVRALKLRHRGPASRDHAGAV